MAHHHIGIQNFIAKTRNRKPQWIHKETQHLIREFDKRKDILRPKQGEVVSSALKHRAWVEISQAVNLTNPHVHRTVSEVQKKWQNLCLRMKKTKDRSSDNEDSRKDVESLILEQSQSFIGQEEGTEDVVTIKVESDDAFEHSGSVNHVNESIESRQDGRQSYTNYTDVDYSSQHEFMTYSNDSGSQQSRGVKRVFEDEGPFAQYQGDVELLSLKKQSLLAEIQTHRLKCDKLQMEKDKYQLEIEKMSLEKDKVAMELQNLRTANQQILLSQHKTHTQLEKERMALENEKLTIEIRALKNQNQVNTEKMQLEKSRLMLENDKLNAEIQRIRSQVGKQDTNYVM